MDLQILQIINLILTIMMTGSGILLAVCKPIRNRIFQVKKREESQEETDKCILRAWITELYYKDRKTGEIRQFEYETMEHMYKQYKKLGGNSFVDKIWEEVQEWRII